MIYEAVIVKDKGKDTEKIVYDAGKFIARSEQEAVVFAVQHHEATQRVLGDPAKKTDAELLFPFDRKTMEVVVRPFV